MSDSEKLRKTYGNLWLTASFVFFTLAVCSIWIIFVTYWGFLMMVFGTVSLLLATISFVFATRAYYTYVGVSEKGISQCDAAKLKKINGILELVSAFVFLALAISCIWIIFLFIEALNPFICVLWGVFIVFFINCIRYACTNLLSIKKLVLKQYNE